MRVTTLGEFAPFHYGKALPERDRRSGNVPVASSAGIVGLHSEALVPTAGIVVGRKGTVGSVTYINTPFWAIDTSFYVLDDPANRDLRFTYYLLKQLPLQQMNSDSAVPGLNREHAHSLEIEVPEFAVQIAIGDWLGNLDDKIELNHRMSQTLEAIAQAIFKSWFVDFDPVLALSDGQEPVQVADRFGLSPEVTQLFATELIDVGGQVIPAGWKLSTLGQEVKAHGGLLQTGPFGSQLHASDYTDEGVPVVMPQDLVNRRIATGRVARIPQATADGLKRHMLKSGDVVYSRRGDVERHALVSPREVGWLCGTGCLLVRMGSGWSSQAYLSETLNDKTTREWIVRHAVGATMPNLNTSILASVPLLVPPAPLLQHFESVVGTLREQQEALSAEAESLAALRDELLPRLLSGELAVV